MEACCRACYLLDLSSLGFRVIKFLWLWSAWGRFVVTPPPPKLPPEGWVGVSWSSAAPAPAPGGLYRGVIAGQRGWLGEAVWVHIQRVFCGWLWVFEGATPAWCVVGVRLLFPLEQLFTWVCTYFRAHWLLCVFVYACASVPVGGKSMMGLWGEAESLWPEPPFQMNAAVSAHTGWKVCFEPEEDGI